MCGFLLSPFQLNPKEGSRFWKDSGCFLANSLRKQSINSLWMHNAGSHPVGDEQGLFVWAPAKQKKPTVRGWIDVQRVQDLGFTGWARFEGTPRQNGPFIVRGPFKWNTPVLKYTNRVPCLTRPNLSRNQNLVLKWSTQSHEKKNPAAAAISGWDCP